MTVIVADGIHVAADGLTVSGGAEIISERTRKIIVRRGAIYTSCGTAALRQPLIAWHEAGAKPEDMPEGDWSLLVIDAGGVGLYHNEVPYRAEMPYQVTLGAGADFAMGALRAGADARRAVEIACAIDIRCGGEIQVVDIAEALGLNVIKEAAE